MDCGAVAQAAAGVPLSGAGVCSGIPEVKKTPSQFGAALFTIWVYHEEFGRLRTVKIGGEPWFVGKDVAEALGYKNTKDALASHVDDEDKQIIQRSENATLEIPNRGMAVIDESGLYSLVMSVICPSKLCNVKRTMKDMQGFKARMCKI